MSSEWPGGGGGGGGGGVQPGIGLLQQGFDKLLASVLVGTRMCSDNVPAT